MSTVVLILLALVWSWRVLAVTESKMNFATEMRKTAFERILLRDEFLIFPQAETAQLWHAKSEQLLKQITTADSLFLHDDSKEMLRAARQDFNATHYGFSRIIESRSGQPARAGFSEAELQQISQVFLKAYSLNGTLDHLHALTHQQAHSQRNNGLVIVLLVIVGGGLAIIINSAVIRRTITKRLMVLQKGVEIIGSGDLDYRIEVEGNDELSALAQSSNGMAAKLKRSYTSLANLQNEVVERKKAEELLRDQESKLQVAITDLQRSNKELEQFAYVASHDLQEPLRMISSYTQLLAERYQDKLDEKANLFIHYAVDGAVRMQQLINDLLVFSRIGTKGKPLEPVDAHAALGKALGNLKMTIDEAKAIITNDKLPEVRGDASQLLQLFQNLIGNALKFRGEKYPHIHIATQDKGQEWLFSVKDNGIGIDPQFADKIFVIFQRLHTKEEYPGSGIGLAICKKIVERHGGRIWFESEPGKGATFYFTIHK